MDEADRRAGARYRQAMRAAIAARWDARPLGAAREAEWQARFAAYRAAFPELAREFERRMAGELPLLEREDVRQWWQRFQARPGFQAADIWTRFQRRRFVQALIEARRTPLAVQD